MEYGINMFGCAEEFQKSPTAFLEKASQMGYTMIEPCIFFGDSSECGEEKRKHLWTVSETDEYAALLRRYGMKIESFHAVGDLLSHMDAVVAVIEKYHIKTIVKGGPQWEKGESFDTYVGNMKNIAKSIEKAGAKLLIHNGPEELSNKMGQATFLEAFLRAMDGLVGCQLDVGWALYGGVDPLDCLNRVKPWCKCLHYKDIREDYKTVPESEIQVCLGDGVLDVPALKKWALENNLPQYIDQDVSSDWMRDLEESIKLLI